MLGWRYAFGIGPSVGQARVWGYLNVDIRHESKQDLHGECSGFISEASQRTLGSGDGNMGVGDVVVFAFCGEEHPWGKDESMEEG